MFSILKQVSSSLPGLELKEFLHIWAECKLKQKNWIVRPDYTLMQLHMSHTLVKTIIGFSTVYTCTYNSWDPGQPAWCTFGLISAVLCLVSHIIIFPTISVLLPPWFEFYFQIPLAIVSTSFEKTVQNPRRDRVYNSADINIPYVLFWSYLFSLITLICLFWTDIIPGFGMTQGIVDFGKV